MSQLSLWGLNIGPRWSNHSFIITSLNTVPILLRFSLRKAGEVLYTAQTLIGVRRAYAANHERGYNLFKRGPSVQNHCIPSLTAINAIWHQTWAHFFLRTFSPEIWHSPLLPFRVYLSVTVFAKKYWKNIAISSIISVRLLVCFFHMQQTRAPLKEFSLNLPLTSFILFCWYQIWITLDKRDRHFTWRPTHASRGTLCPTCWTFIRAKDVLNRRCRKKWSTQFMSNTLCQNCYAMCTFPDLLML